MTTYPSDEPEHDAVRRSQRGVHGPGVLADQAGGGRGRGRRTEGAHPPALAAPVAHRDAPDEGGDAEEHLDRMGYGAEVVVHPEPGRVDVARGARVIPSASAPRCRRDRRRAAPAPRRRGPGRCGRGRADRRRAGRPAPRSVAIARARTVYSKRSGSMPTRKPATPRAPAVASSLGDEDLDDRATVRRRRASCRAPPGTPRARRCRRPRRRAGPATAVATAAAPTSRRGRLRGVARPPLRTASPSASSTPSAAATDCSTWVSTST